MFVEHCLVAIDEKNIDKTSDYYNELWFAGIYREIHNWYKNKYGSLKPKDDKFNGLIVALGIPRSINIPRTITSRCEDGKLKITFPSRVYDKERPLGWVRPTIKTKTLSRGQVSRLRKRVTEIAGKVRKINLNCGAGEQSTLAMSRSIIFHLSQAAQLANSQSRQAYSLAMWEMHLACEKCIKCYLAQEEIPYPNIHCILRLVRLADNVSYKNEASRLSKRLPSGKEAINHRYQEIQAPTLQKLYATYKNTLKICLVTTNQFKAKINYSDASVFLKKPPWMSQLE